MRDLDNPQEKSHPEVAKTAKAVRRLPTNNKKNI